MLHDGIFLHTQRTLSLRQSLVSKISMLAHLQRSSFSTQGIATQYWLGSCNSLGITWEVKSPMTASLKDPMMSSFACLLQPAQLVQSYIYYLCASMRYSDQIWQVCQIHPSIHGCPAGASIHFLIFGKIIERIFAMYGSCQDRRYPLAREIALDATLVVAVTLGDHGAMQPWTVWAAGASFCPGSPSLACASLCKGPQGTCTNTCILQSVGDVKLSVTNSVGNSP